MTHLFHNESTIPRIVTDTLTFSVSVFVDGILNPSLAPRHLTSIKEVSLVLKSTIMAAANSETVTREETTERRGEDCLNKQ